MTSYFRTLGTALFAWVLIVSILVILSGCNWTSQLDRDAGFCVVISKTSGAACNVDIKPTQVVGAQ